MKKEQYGWICPKCGKVHAPFVFACTCAEKATKVSGATDFRDQNMESQAEYFGRK